jgi:Ca-activated chloride channel family protein
MKKLLTILLLFISGHSFSQPEQAEKEIQAGNTFYKQQQYDNAATEYRKAITSDPANSKAKFNLANTLAKQGKPDEAVKSFTEISDNTKDAELKSKAFYNKGAILSQQKKLEESIEAYKNALRQNPDDKEARENLQKALLELKKKNPPKQKKEDQKKNPQKQPQSKMNRKEAEQRLKLLEQKEKEVQQRLQKEKSKAGGSQAKDW